MQILAAQVTAELRQLAANAASVLNEHVNDHGYCAACGYAWPCESAVLAEHDLELA